MIQAECLRRLAFTLLWSSVHVLCVCICVSASQRERLEKQLPGGWYRDAVGRDLCPVEHSVAPSRWQFDR